VNNCNNFFGKLLFFAVLKGTNSLFKGERETF